MWCKYKIACIGTVEGCSFLKLNGAFVSFASFFGKFYGVVLNFPDNKEYP